MLWIFYGILNKIIVVFFFMARQKKIFTDRKKQLTVRARRCSVCKQTGHTKLNCVLLSSPFKSQKKNSIKSAQSTYANRPIVSVQVHSEIPVSPHVVELRDRGVKQNKLSWDTVGAYYEQKNDDLDKAAMDWAELVRKANEQSVLKKITVSKPWLFKSSQPVAGIVNNQIFKTAVHSFRVKRFVATVLILIILGAIPFSTIGYYRKVKTDSLMIIEQSTNAFLALQSSTIAALASNIPQAKHDLNAALVEFGQAQTLIDKDYKGLLYVVSLLPIVGEKVASRQRLLVAGHHLALGNTYLVKGIGEATQTPNLNFVDRIEIMRGHIRSAVPQYEQTLRELSQVDSATVPVEYQSLFSEFKVLFTSFIDDMKDFNSVLSGLETILGGDDFRRYLILFQNNNELRPTGGFVGSFAVVDVQKGKLLNVDVPGGGSYDVQGQLDTYLRPPLPLQLINYRWEFQDGNWFPDFAASAQKMAWFYQHSRGTTVDGVIAINASVLERLLRVIGPVYNDSYNLALSTDTALAALQTKVELDYDKTTNQPKAVIAEVLAQLLSLVQTIKPDQLVALLTELNAALTEKEIQVYFPDEKLQKQFRDFGWTGELAASNDHQDYLMVVHTNLGGGKSNARVEEIIEHEAVVSADGSVIDTVTLKRKHTGTPGELFFGETNLDYVRLYVPKGSELLAAGGFVYPVGESFLIADKWFKTDEDLTRYEQERGVHIQSGTRLTEEFGKTVFGNWIVTKPGEVNEVWFRYKLPFKVITGERNNSQEILSALLLDTVRRYLKSDDLLSQYSLIIQKQSGTNSNFTTTIIYPDGWRPVWRTDEKMELSLNGASYANKLTTDQWIGLIMKQTSQSSE